MDLIITQKQYIKINLLINNEFYIQDLIAIVDSSVDLNCIKEGIIPLKYCKYTTQTLSAANNKALSAPYKVTDVNICKDKVCIPLHFLIVKEISQVILGTPFLGRLMPIKQIDEKGTVTCYKGQTVTFEFITNPIVKLLNEVKEIYLKKSN